MKLNHLIYTLMLGTALGTSSCSWLDLEPATAVSPSILGQGEVEQLLTVIIPYIFTIFILFEFVYK